MPEFIIPQCYEAMWQTSDAIKAIARENARQVMAQVAWHEHNPATINTWRDEVVYIATSPVSQPHSDERPFCADPTCGCKTDMDLLLEHILRPFDTGLLTVDECQYIYHNVHI